MKSGSYFKSGIFYQYITDRPYNGYSDNHWKIHINYPVYLANDKKKIFLHDILSFLSVNDINHKYVKDERNIIYRMNRPSAENSQNGKIITVYCNNETDCFVILDILDKMIRKKGYIHYPLEEEQMFRNDRLFRNNPYLGYRHASTPRMPFYVTPIDEYGNEILDIQKKYDKWNLINSSP